MEDCMVPIDGNLYRIVILGNGGVGKSCLTVRLTTNLFQEDYDPTIETTYRMLLSTKDEPAMLEIVDTAGQEEYSAMRDQIISIGKGFVIVYSVTDKSSYDAVKSLHDRVRFVKESIRHDISQIPMVCAANKSDDYKNRVIDDQAVQELASTLKVPTLLTSAKNGLNVTNLFVLLVTKIRESESTTSVTETSRRKFRLCVLL